MSNSLRPNGLYSPWDSPGQNPGVGSLTLLQGIFNPGIEPRSPTLQADFLAAEPPGKPLSYCVYIIAQDRGAISLFYRKHLFKI